MTITPDTHHAGHGQPISRRQRRARAERYDQQDATDKKRPIDKRDIDLTGVRLMGVQEIEPRKKTQPDRLRGQRKGRRNQRLRRDDRGDGGQQHHRKKHRRRHQAVKQLAAGNRGAGQKIGALPEIVEQ
jgi:hypothetical protein